MGDMLKKAYDESMLDCPEKPMTSKSKCPVCPWCNQPMVLQDDIFVCANTDCSSCAESFLHKALIQAKQDLEIARKAMEDIDMLLYSRKFDITELGRLNIIQYLVSRALKLTEHKE